MLLYNPWRRWIDQAKQIRHQPQQLQDDEETGTVVVNEAATSGKDVHQHEEETTIEDQPSRISPTHEAEAHGNIAEDIVL